MSSPPEPAAILECCVDSLDSAIAAERGGASRVELCAGLSVGGITPDARLVEQACTRLGIPVFVMVRPRGGDFVYDAGERRRLHEDLDTVIAAGAHGVVSGALRADGTIDAAFTRALRERAGSLPFTFHRAFDHTRDLDQALDHLIAIGVSRVLTSGGGLTAAEGADRLAALVRLADSRLSVLAGGGVRAHNVAALVRRTGVREVHARLAGSDVPGFVRELNAVSLDRNRG
jgi:copper homeostasis protein